MIGLESEKDLKPLFSEKNRLYALLSTGRDVYKSKYKAA